MAGDNIIDIYIRGSDQRLYVLINGNGANFKTSNARITNNVWTHVAFTFSPNNGYIYINGVRDELTNGTSYTSFAQINPYGSLLIGARWAGSSGENYQKGFRGYMNFINIFNQTLSDSNITYLYNNASYGQTTEGGLMTIGIENDTPYNDRIALWPNSGTGYVGINTKTPQATLDINGTLNINGNITNNSGAVGITGETGTLLTLKNTNTVGAGSQVNIDFMTQTGNYGMARISALDTTPNNNGSIGGYTTSMIFYLAGVNTVTEYMKLTYLGLTVAGESVICGNKLLLQAASDNHCYIRNTYASTNTYLYLGANNVNIVTVASTGITVSGVTTSTSFNATSDYREKENVVQLDDSFTIDGLNPVTYNLKNSGRQDIGFIAHEVQEFYPFLVLGEKDGKERQSLNYNGFIGILTKEIKVLKKKVAEQEARIVEQEAKAAEQDARIQALEKMVFDLINK